MGWFRNAPPSVFSSLPLDPNGATLFTYGWSSKFREKCDNSDWNHRNHWTHVDNPLLIQTINIINQHQCNDVPTMIRLSDGEGVQWGIWGGVQWGSGGGVLGTIFFQFHAVLGDEIAKIIAFLLHFLGWRPSSKSWIRHWNVQTMITTKTTMTSNG